MGDEAELLPGTLDLLILKAVSLVTASRLRGPFVNRTDFRQTVVYRTGALYPALFCLVRQGLLKTEWGKIGEPFTHDQFNLWFCSGARSVGGGLSFSR